MTSPIQIAFNPTVAKVIDPTKEVKKILSQTLSFVVEGHEHMGRSGWDGRSSFFSMLKGTFPAGFVHMAQSALIKHGYQVQFVRHPLPAPLGPENPIVDAFGNDNPDYDYQMRTVQELLRHGRGIAQIATGGGKSKIAMLAIARIKRMTLFLTTRNVLMYQMKDQLEKQGFSVGVIGDGEFAPRSGVNVGMVQTLVARLKENSLADEIRSAIGAATDDERDAKPRSHFEKIGTAEFERKEKIRNATIKLLGMFEFVIGEEAHEAGGNSYFEIMQHCRNAHYRLALTATPFMRTNEEDNMRLMAAFGPVLIKVSEKLLIDRGILATPVFKYIDAQPHPKLRRTTPWQRAYQLGIIEGQHRNAHIVRETCMAARYKLPTLILVQRKNHGKMLEEVLRKRGLKALFMWGETDQTTRRKALAALGGGKLDVLIGTTILDVGVDVPAVGMIILGGGGKAEVALRQRIGRGLRRKKTGPNYAFIVDFVDSGSLSIQEHAATRRAIVEATPGFSDNILAPGVDFSWSMFD